MFENPTQIYQYLDMVYTDKVLFVETYIKMYRYVIMFSISLFSLLDS